MSLLFLFIFTFFSGVCLEAAEKYPVWFLHQEDYPDIVVGYGLQNNHPTADAEQRYVIYRFCSIKGEIYQYRQWNQRHSNYEYNFIPDSLEAVKGRLNVLDIFMANSIAGDMIAAYSTDPSVTVSKDKVNIFGLESPEWVSRYPAYEDAQYYYGIGTYTARGSESDAWRVAEDNAILNILNLRQIQIFTVTLTNRTDRSGDIENLIAYRYDYLVRNIRVLQRWRDPENTMLHVLVRISKNDIKDRKKSQPIYGD